MKIIEKKQSQVKVNNQIYKTLIIKVEINNTIKKYGFIVSGDIPSDDKLLNSL